MYTVAYLVVSPPSRSWIRRVSDPSLHAAQALKLQRNGCASSYSWDSASGKCPHGKKFTLRPKLVSGTMLGHARFRLPIRVRDAPPRPGFSLSGGRGSLDIHGHGRRASTGVAEDVGRTLALRPKQVHSKYLYDALGSLLFESISRLPWYRITRAEHELIERHAPAIISALPDPATFVELGSGSGENLQFGGSLGACGPSGRDPSDRHLPDGARAVAPYAGPFPSRGARRPPVHLRGRLAPRGDPADRRGDCHGAVARLEHRQLRAWAAHEFLCEIRGTLRSGDVLLFGADLVKPEADMLLAYDDPLGVTAAFNKNLLVRLNRELRAEFDLGRFDHRALWNAAESRVEIHLVSRCAQEVRIPIADCVVHFAEGESILDGELVQIRAGDGCRDGQRRRVSSRRSVDRPGRPFSR